MKGVSVLLFLGFCLSWAQAQFFNHRPFPTYSLENMPDTAFSCRDKILGGYYADADTECQMFHVCVKVAGVGVQDFRFLCPNGTAFDQDHQICADWDNIDCDATTLYYSSDNFDLYRLGSGFESKAHKYGEDEETFSLQRAETGDARINHEQQSNVVNQRKEPRYFNSKPKQKQNNNNNQNNNNQNTNNEKDIFRGSSSSNFYNNRNSGKEKDEDYDDNVNVNQDRDFEQKRKVVKNKVRRPVQNNDYNKNQNGDYNRNTQNNDYNKNNQNNDYNRKTQSSDYNRNNQFSEGEDQKNDNIPEVQTRRTSPTRNTDFTNNFAGSSYVPTTARSTSTTLNAEQYSTAINNYRSRNGQRQRQYTNTDSASYTISTPAPFRQTQQYNPPPSRQNNNGRYYSTTQAPQKETENYPQQKPKQTTAFDNYDVPKVKQTGTTSAQNYNSQYDIPKVKQTGSTPAQTYNTQYESAKVKQTGSTASQSYNTQYEATKSKFTSTTAQYEATKVKPANNFPKSTTSQKTENYPTNNPKYNTFDKKQTTPYKQLENYQTTLSPKPFSLNNFPSTFAPRTSAEYTQIAQQTVNYRKSSTQNQNSQSTGFSQQAKNSTPRSTPFTQYTPTVPKLSSTTPVSRSSRFDETQYDDGSYSTKYDYDNDKKEDEFLKTAHSQNIAASRNEFAKSTKQQSSTQTQRTSYESPRPFSVTPKVTPKVTELPKTSPKPVEAKKPTPSPKKTKNVSYDYAYYDSNVGSEPDYDITEDIQKSSSRN